MKQSKFDIKSLQYQFAKVAKGLGNLSLWQKLTFPLPFMCRYIYFFLIFFLFIYI